MGLPLTFTSCEEVLGEWSKPTPIINKPNTTTTTTTTTPEPKTAGAISYATASLAKGSQDPAFTNELTITGDGTVSYSSSNEAVATVDPNTGEVTPKGAGTVSITATVSDSETYTYETNSASYSLNVTDGYQYQKWDGSKFTTQYAATSDCQQLVDAASATWDNTKIYVAKGNVTITGTVTISENSKLILCDGATLTINGKLYNGGTNYNLIIYTQSDGDKTGALNVTVSNDNAITLGYLTIHGGKITATAEGTSTESKGIYLKSIAMFAGNLTAQGNNRGGAGILFEQKIDIKNKAKLEAKGGDNNSGSAGYGINSVISGATISVSENANLTVTGGNGSGDNTGGSAVSGTNLELTASGNANVKLTGGNTSGNAYGGHGVNGGTSGNVTASGNACIEATGGDGSIGGCGISPKLTISGNASVKAQGGNMTYSGGSKGGDAIDNVYYHGGSFTATGGVNSSNTTNNGKGIKTSITNNSASDVDFEYGTDGSNWTTKTVTTDVVEKVWSDATVNSLYIRTKP